MEQTIALAVIIFFGMHLMSRVRFFISNRKKNVVLVRNSIDILFTLGILTISFLQLIQLETNGTARNYTWYLLGLVAIYVLWLGNTMRNYRTDNSSKGKSRKNNKR